MNKNFGNTTSASQGPVAGAFVTLFWGMAVLYGGITPPPAEIYGASIIIATWLWQLLVK